MVRVLEADAFDAVLFDLVDLRPREGEEHGRVRRDDELGSVLHQVVHVLHQADDAPGRQGRLRLIQDIQALAAEPVLHQGKEAFPVGLPVQGDPAVAVDNRRAPAAFPVQLVDVGGHVVKALRPQEEPVPGADHAPGHPEMVAQLRMGILRGEIEVLRSALRIEPLGDGQGFDQGGFPGSVLPHKEGHLFVELNPLFGQVLHHRQAGQVVSLRDGIKKGHAADVQVFFLHTLPLSVPYFLVRTAGYTSTVSSEETMIATARIFSSARPEDQ